MIAARELVDLAEIHQSDIPLVGGKGANLGATLRAGFAVPPGFCLTTSAYHQFTAPAEAFIAAQLATLNMNDTAALDAASSAIRVHLESLAISDEMITSIRDAYQQLAAKAREHHLLPPDAGEPPVAVRSSATAEDLPDASFAGQQDTLLNIRGLAALLVAIKRCWSSLWTARAIAYRERNGFRHEDVALAVIVQIMIDADVAGVLFTADPVNGYRTRMIINGAWGLGEAIVSGSVSPDTWTIDHDGIIISTERGRKEVMVRYAETGGTIEQPVPPDRQTLPCLDAPQLRRLAELGRKAEQFFGSPQDIEWAVAGDSLWLLQSRPITTLFPLPEPRPTDNDFHMYISFNNLQGLLEPITPMGIAFFRELGRTVQAFLGIPVFRADGTSALAVAADRLFIDVTPLLRSPRWRPVLLGAFGQADPLTGYAVREVLADPRLALKPPPTRQQTIRSILRLLPIIAHGAKRVARNVANPERAAWRVEHELQPRLLAMLAQAERAETFSERLLMVRVLLRAAVPLMAGYVPVAFAPGLIAGAIMERLVRRWHLPDEKLPLLRQGLPHNPTTEMDLALWSISRAIAADDAARQVFTQHDPADVAQLFREHRLPNSAQAALHDFLERYGHRGVREIDLGMPRWADDPTYIIGVLRNYLQLNDQSHAPDQHFVQLQRNAAVVEAELIAAAQKQVGGFFKAAMLRFLIKRLRTLAGLREGPKFWVVRIQRSIRRLLTGCGAILVQRGLINAADDVMFLALEELQAIDAGANEPLQARVAQRRQRYAQELQRHRVPRVVTSEGLVVYGRAQATGENVLAGVGVSPGAVQGHARIIRDPHGAQLTPGDILVAPSTDPAWTPLFLAAGGLVMEAGGMLSHGSVVAREYGIPAVVAVANATTVLRDGQVIRVDGTGGVVELVSEAAEDELLKVADQSALSQS